MSEVVKPELKWQDWEGLFPAQSESSGKDGHGNKAEWVKFDKPGTYDIRLIGKPVSFFKHGQKPYGVFTKRTITHEDYKAQDPAWQAGFFPRKTFAINVIDRRDSKLKVLEKGKTIFESFQNFKTTNDINPADPKEAPDFQIKVIWPNGDKNKAEYTVTPKMKASPLTNDEIESIKASAIDLRQLYKPNELSYIVEQWNQVPEDQRVPPKRETKGSGKPTSSGSQSNAATSARANSIREKVEVPAESSGEEDLFGTNTDDSSF